MTDKEKIPEQYIRAARISIEESFDLLLDSLESAIIDMNEAGSAAIRTSNYTTATEAMRLAKAILECRKGTIDILERLRMDWEPQDNASETSQSNDARSEPIARRRHLTVPATPRNEVQQTPQNTFMPYILAVLVEMGGSASAREVRSHVGRLLAGKLLPDDYTTLPNHRDIRWENGLAWARAKLVADGRLANDSPTGVWQISDVGRRWLQQHPVPAHRPGSG